MMSVPCPVWGTLNNGNYPQVPTIPFHHAFILHTRPYRETSLLLEAFSAEFGRVGLLAKGARRGKSRWRGLLQPFRLLLVSWVNRRELGLLTGVEPEMPLLLLRGRAVLSGFYLNELLLRLLEREDPQPQLFQSYLTAVRDLTEQHQEEPILRVFEKRLLDAIGYGLTLDRDVLKGQSIDPNAVYYYRLDSGPGLEPTPDPPEVRIGGRTLLALAQDHVSGSTELREAKRLLRLALQRQLGERPLMSRTLFRQPIDPPWALPKRG
jgi:DNA repair protein RecO (recombination protein O)